MITSEYSNVPDPDQISIHSSSDDEYSEYHLYLSDTDDSDDATSIVENAMEIEASPEVVIHAQRQLQSSLNATVNESRHSANTVKSYFSPATVITSEHSNVPDPDQISIHSSSDDEHSEYHLYLSDTDDSDDATSIVENTMEIEASPKVVIHAQPQSHPLPFPSLSIAWYKHQRELAVNNAARSRSRRSNTAKRDTEGNIVSINRSSMEETLEQSIQRLQANIDKTSDSRAESPICPSASRKVYFS